MKKTGMVCESSCYVRLFRDKSLRCLCRVEAKTSFIFLSAV